MNRGDGTMLGIRQKDWDAIGGLDHEQDARFAGDERVCFWRLLALRDVRGTHDVNDVRMNLAQPYGAHPASVECCQKFLTIFQHPIGRIPCSETEVEYLFAGRVSLAICRKFARTPGTCAETVHQPI